MSDVDWQARSVKPRLFGCTEAGGTKIVCAVMTEAGAVQRETVIATATPGETLAAVEAFFARAADEIGRCCAYGVASFGPLNLDSRSPLWGRIAATPKPGWSGADMLAPFRRFGVPLGFDTDVNAAAVAEACWGAARGTRVAVYLTVGTGIGGGVVVDGRPLHGLVHPEIGHVRVERAAADQGFEGVCPFHADCVEGLASGPAIVRRTGKRLALLPTGHPVRELVADYLGQLCATLVLTLSPQRILIGGGVSAAPDLHAAAALRMRQRLGGYVAHPALEGDSFIVPPALGQRAGLFGALALAQAAAARIG